MRGYVREYVRALARDFEKQTVPIYCKRYEIHDFIKLLLKVFIGSVQMENCQTSTDITVWFL